MDIDLFFNITKNLPFEDPNLKCKDRTGIDHGPPISYFMTLLGTFPGGNPIPPETPLVLIDRKTGKKDREVKAIGEWTKSINAIKTDWKNDSGQYYEINWSGAIGGRKDLVAIPQKYFKDQDSLSSENEHKAPEADAMKYSETEKNLITLEKELLLEPSGSLIEYYQLIQEKRQIIFFGPPGTGKTYVAQQFAEGCAGSSDRVRIVQFHPSYAYEDFVQGFRPQQSNSEKADTATAPSGQMQLKLVDGPLLDLAKAAQNDPDHHYILLIDEINRGNLAKVFGELYFLLEYRNKQLRLQYSSATTFSLPENLWIIGTMNTADRSIALLDAALRRRFYFIPFFPTQKPIDGLLLRWLKKNGQYEKYGWLDQAVNRANEMLNNGDAAIGPSYFMRHSKPLDDAWIERVWQYAIMPYVEEQLYDDKSKLDQFKLDQIRKNLNLSNGAS